MATIAEHVTAWPRRRLALLRILTWKGIQLLGLYERAPGAETLRFLESEFWALYWAVQRLDEVFS